MPRDFELAEFERLYRQYNVTDVVRTCEECQYNDEFLKGLNIEGHVILTVRREDVGFRIRRWQFTTDRRCSAVH